jgi:chemotaxis protein histidine kinase CheA
VPEWSAIGSLAALTERATSLAPSLLRPLTVAPGPADDDGTWRVQAKDVVTLLREIERLRELRYRIEMRETELRGAADLVAGSSLYEPLFGVARGLRYDAEETASVIEALEERVKAISAQPFGTITEPLFRIVRDACRATGKEARLSTVGTEIALDRRVLESIKSSLVLLVQNAIDHGVEAPEERVRRGKHREAVIVVRVEQQGNVVFVQVEDDGAGLDLARIKKIAEERGLGTAEQLARMSGADIRDIIFHPGFSTKDKISPLSGRGVGMDVVKRAALALRGHLDVESQPGEGTRFTMRLPVEIGSSPVLVVRAAGQEFGLPMHALDGVTMAREGSIVAGRDDVHLVHEDELLVLRDLAGLLRLRQPRVPKKGDSVLLVRSQGQRMALAVDEACGEHEFIIRPLPTELRDVPAYQGITTGARGALLLVLRPSWLVDRKALAIVPTQLRRALVVDDSLTARALHRAALEAGGYAVHAVSSATEALERLIADPYDVVVCDVAMRPMDGVAFTARLREDATTRGVPVILVSAHDTEGVRARGLAAGANAFLSKKECAAGRLLVEAARVLASRAPS